MKKEFLQKVIPGLSLLLALVCAACSGKEIGNPEKLLLSLNFDEGAGNQVLDGAGQAQPAVVKYLFTNAAYMDARSPEWRSQGVSGGCLLFDGCSNYIGYEPEELMVRGEALTISVWAALRAGLLPAIERHHAQCRRQWNRASDCHCRTVQQGKKAGVPPGLSAVWAAVLSGGNRRGVADALGGRR